MAVIRNEIEKHLEINGEMLVEQSGFTKNARIEDNITILKYLIQDARKRKKELVITGVDFAKAFDSIKREKILETLKYYKIDPRVIDAVANIYKDDRIELSLGKNLKEEIIATNGIRQGCTLSATLFKLISYRIIKEINIWTKGYATENIVIRTLFFADDGLLVSDSVEQATEDIRSLQAITKQYGLELNKSKSSILVFNVKNKPDNIDGINITQEMKYLGVTIQDTRDIFKKHKETKLKLAERLSNCAYSVINRCCNRILIGKTYWKNIVVPALIYGSGAIDWTKAEQEKLQIKQNQVCRKIMNAPSWSTNSGLRGEIGMSTMEGRLMQSKIGYISNRLKAGNNLIKEIVEYLIADGPWKKYVEQQVEKLDTGRNTLLKYKKEYH